MLKQLVEGESLIFRYFYLIVTYCMIIISETVRGMLVLYCYYTNNRKYIVVGMYLES